MRDQTYLLLCGDTVCFTAGSIRVKDALPDTINEKGLREKIHRNKG
ncbi:hypothetical protein DSCW_50190 [Desulfosarcina widdelii]|uniref:Uncharacterized protein n=1 Tax=Desulfosarcina widdelii TaxID=947919 RepID=A0A5K7Z6H1_9BACT|nr:hypothetical protein [Desulfosarcina widdelii]BBO77602.1 hypothetical protein DSCW_50190 [Desulfosarcina widdelii]